MQHAPPYRAADNRRLIWHAKPTAMTSPAFEVTSKRRKGYPSETHVKRGLRFVHGDVELVEKLGRNDPCPCGSGKSFQALLPAFGTVSTGPSGMITGETR
ncbi:SEC-C metal-binding domain-containing protein [Sphingomonas sp. 7/4-4]|nr:SEC-C metal-binding domain-containing protein [Sphingomonas sp. 7/4-4]WBY09008.1 SEC-C metal-binding domain-containing protein [Sphingomonas sp. 7/4-4]